MSATFVKVPGVVKFFNTDKGFGFVRTAAGDAFIHASVAGDLVDALVREAVVVVDFVTRYVDGSYKREVTSLISVTAPPTKPEPISVLDTVIWFDPGKGFGFVSCGGRGLSKDQAHMHVSVAERAGVIPGSGMPIRAHIVEAKQGPKVVSFEWGLEVEEAYKAHLAALHAKDGAVADVGEDVSSEPTEAAPVAAATPAAEVKAEKAKPKQRRAPKSPIGKKPTAKKTAAAPTGVAAEVAASALSLNGSGGAMADAFKAAVETAH